MAELLNKDPEVYVQEQENFVRELRKHHDQKGTSFRHLPSLNGKEIDLYLLYWLVTAQGGWEKVNSENRWEDLLESFEIESSTVNGSLALKQIYLRHLDSYEKAYFNDEDEEDRDVYYDEEDSRSRRHKQQRIGNNVPATYHEAQHKVSDTVRAHYGLSMDLYQATDYDRLCLSLLSPLPNEQDFAINVATLLSNEGKHTLKLSRCPRLLDLLCAHAGVFNHHSLRNYIDENYRDIRQYHQVQFWRDVCRNTAVLELIYDEKNFYPKPAEETENFFASQFVTKYTADNSAGRLSQMLKRVEQEVSDSDLELFAVGRTEGTKEPNGQRVLQVATILRNVSFEEDNVPILARNLTLLRFVLLCVNSSWSNLNQTGFDILSNIASEMQLEEPEGDAVTDLMMKTLAKCIGDQDRFQVISSLDVLTKLCALQTNEELVTRIVQSSVYRKLIDYLSLHDIHLLIATLECLFSLSNLGETPCNSIVKTHSAIELLVSLVTVEAQSYGPKACILMRVVETVPQPGSQQTASGQPPQLTTLSNAANPTPSGTNVSLPNNVVSVGNASQMNPSISTAPSGVQAGQPSSMPPQGAGMVQQVRPQLLPKSAVGVGAGVSATPPNITLPKHPLPLASTRPMLNQQPGMPTQQQQPQQQVISLGGGTIPGGSMQQAANQQVQLRVSNDEPHRVFCLSWLKATYEPAPTKSIEQNIMYKQYLASMHRMGRKEVISSQHYALCIRTLFGGSTGPNRKQIGDKNESHFTDIQVRAQPLPLKLTPAQAQAAQEASRQQQQLAQQPQQQIQQTLAAQKPVPYQSLPNQPVIQKQPIVQPSVIQPSIVRPSTPQQQTPAAAASAAPGGGQIMQLVNQHGQVVQGQLVNATTPSGQVIQMINQGGQLVQVSGANTVGGQVVQVSGQGQVNLVQQPQQQTVMPGQQIIQNIVNAQGQVIQKRIITQPAQSVMIGGQTGATSQAQVVRGAGGQQMIVARPPSAGPVMMQSQGGQLIQVQGGQGAQPVLMQGGQIVMQGGQQYVQQAGGQPNLVVSSGNNMITTQQPQISNNKAEDILENGISPLDGILPKDPSFGGKLEADNLSDLLHRNKPVLVNGVKENNPDYSKLNGDSLTMLGKRGPQDMDGVLPAAKKPAVDNGTIIPMTNGMPNGNGQMMNGTASNGSGPTVKLLPGGQMVVQNSVQQQQQQPQIIQTSSGQFYLKANSANGGSTMVPAQQVINQQGKAVLVFNQDQQQPQQPQQQIVKQVINTPSGQQIVRQVVVSSTAMIPSGAQSTVVSTATMGGGVVYNNSVVTTNGINDSSSTTMRQTPPLTNGDSNLSPSSSPAPSLNSCPSPPPAATQPIKIDPNKPFLCEWAGCMKAFKNPKEVERHAIAEHCPLRLEGMDIACQWARCDGMKRRRFSLMTHFQDRHCHPQLMKLMAVRRVQIAHNGKSDVPLPPNQPPHPGYAPNAALHAIKRHAQEFVTPKEQELKDEKEGPVTKSIRLTASLILRNLVIYSPSGRLRIRAYESHLSTVALSNVESARTVAQILYEMDNAKEFT